MVSDVLKGQVALVTGGSRGIGREIARALAMQGAKVAVTARNSEKLRETVKLITDAGGECAAFTMDVTDYNSIAQAVGDIVERYGAIDLLVNNAGIGGGGAPLWDSDIDEWWYIQEVNVKGVMMVCRAVMPAMIERRQGRVINIGSYAAFYPNGDSSGYSVSKAALTRITDCTAEAAKEYGVSVFVISPGLVMTDMTRDAPPFQDLPASAWTPIEKSGELCVQLATGKADQLTGRFIHCVDDDLDELIARAGEIIENDTQVMRLVR